MNHYTSQATLNLTLHKKRLIPKIARTFMDEYDKKADQNNLIESVDDPWNFIKFKDNTINKNIVYFTCIPYLFSESRSGPLIVIDQEVLEGNNSNLSHHNDLLNKYKREHGITNDDSEAAYDQGYEKYKNVGVGSYFNKVVLLEYVTTDNMETADIEEGTNSGGKNGNYEMVKGALLAHGYQKIYVNNFTRWTSKEYKRLAKLKAKKTATIVNGQIQSLDDLNDDSIKLGDTIKLYNRCLQDLHEDSNAIPYIYINGNFINGNANSSNNMRTTHQNLVQRYKDDKSLHVNDKDKHPDLYWERVNVDKLLQESTSFIKYNNIIILYNNWANPRLPFEHAIDIYRKFNCKMFIIDDAATDMMKLAYLQKKYYQIYCLYI